MMVINKNLLKLSFVLLCALATPKLNACDSSPREALGEALGEDWLSQTDFIKARFNYREDQTLHLVAAAVGYGCYKDLSTEDFEKRIESLVEGIMKDPASKQSSPFDVVYEYEPDVYSPLSSLYRAFEAPWSDEQMQQAAIITKIYSQYESPMPKTLSHQGPSLLHVLLSKDHHSYPELVPVYAYFKALFDKEVPTSTDATFLVYAYIFYQFDVGQEEALSLVKSRIETLKTDMTPHLEQLEVERVENPYTLLRSFLETSDAWRLCMDFTQQRSGKYWVNYEMMEPGTIPSLLEGFNFLHKTQGKRLSVDYLQSLHDIAFQHSNAKPSRGLKYGLPDTTPLFILGSRKYSHISTVSYIRAKSGFTLKMEMKPIEDLNPLLKGFIEDYYDVIEDKNASFGDKVVAANELSHALVITHPHRDGNTRTFTTLLLNKTLMDLGLPPCLFEDPNAFDGHTSPEALPLILKGIENFKTVRDAQLPDGMRTTQEWIDLKEERQKKIAFIPKASKHKTATQLGFLT
tara:strand:+ start:661 stop:2214 length:1554 start_codon:yes stop_codon:yes gene_type:complete